MQETLIGHNSADLTVEVETRLFNTLSRYADAEGRHRKMELSAGATVGDLIALIGIPVSEIFLVLCNGRDITPGLYQAGAVNREHVISDGDVIAFSGPVPYSYGYGSPVV
ncbi:MAG: MoaD/ThiS family protein [Hyphomicrobiaceae bacterium]